MRGHGRSDKPPGSYSIPLFARDVAGLIEGLGIAPAHVVGISLGGMIALQLAADRPDLVRSLVVVNSSPDMVVRTWRQRLEVWQRSIIVPLLGMKKMAELLGPRLFPKVEQGDLRELFVQRWQENDPRAYRQTLRAIVGWSVADRLPAIDCPVLVVAGDQDYTPVAYKASYVERLPHAELVVMEDSYHGTPVDQPEAFNEALAAFLQRCAGPGTTAPLPPDPAGPSS